MFFTEFSYVDFLNSSRWDSLFFNMDDSSLNTEFSLVKLKELVKERKQGIECKKYPDYVFNYIGMENIEPSQSCLVDFEPKVGSEIKSRSKVYRHGDVLYGRLRPNLNKVYLVDDCLTEGVCSTEFFVLVCNEKVESRYIEAVLSSEYIRNKVVSLVSGATLPRVSIKEFLELEVPLPPIDVQNKISKFYYENKLERERYKIKSELLLGNCRDAIFSFLSGESNLEAYEGSHEIKTWNNPLPDLEL